MVLARQMQKNSALGLPAGNTLVEVLLNHNR